MALRKFSVVLSAFDLCFQVVFDLLVGEYCF